MDALGFQLVHFFEDGIDDRDGGQLVDVDVRRRRSSRS